MKPSERLAEMFEKSKARYENFDVDSSQIATLSNVLMGTVADILDEQHEEIKRIKGFLVI